MIYDLAIRRQHVGIMYCTNLYQTQMLWYLYQQGTHHIQACDIVYASKSARECVHKRSCAPGNFDCMGPKTHVVLHFSYRFLYGIFYGFSRFSELSVSKFQYIFGRVLSLWFLILYDMRQYHTIRFDKIRFPLWRRTKPNARQGCAK